VKLVEFRVKNFRGIQEISLTDLGDFNIFVGKNNSGKSTIMDAIQFFFRGLRTKIVHSHGDEAHDQMWPEGRSDISDMEFEAIIRLDTEDAEFEAGIYERLGSPDNPSGCLINISRKMDQKKQWTTTKLSVGSNSVIPNPNPDIDVNGVHLVIGNVPHHLKRIDVVRGRVPDPSLMRGMRNTLIPEDTLRAIKGWINSELTRDELRFRKLNEIFKQLTVKEWELRQVGEHLRLEDKTYVAHVREIGGGIQEMVQLAYELVEIPEFLIVEEPETHSHPDQVKRIFKVLRDISLEKQVFVATHSTYFLELSGISEIYHVREVKGHIVCQHIISEQLDSVALDLGLGPVDFYMTSGLVFVEGDCEEIVFPEWAKMFDFSLSKPDAKIVNMKGTGKTEHNVMAYDILTKEVDLPMVWVFDKIKDKKMKDKMRKIGIHEDSIVILDVGDIEDYYPIKPLEEHLVQQWNIDKKDELGKSLKAGNRVESIHDFLIRNADPAPDKENDWKIPAARYIATRAKKEDYTDKELKQVKGIIERINKVLSD
jgi:ABC-type branched-subunit amino acid transport system ATPase component